MKKYLITIQIIETGQEFNYEIIHSSLIGAITKYITIHGEQQDFEIISIKKIEKL